jgi:hypothetical protein
MLGVSIVVLRCIGYSQVVFYIHGKKGNGVIHGTPELELQYHWPFLSCLYACKTSYYGLERDVLLYR